MNNPVQAAPDYKVVRFLVRRGFLLSTIVALVPIALGLAALALGASWWWAVAGVLVAPVAYLLFRSYVELVCIIADTLLPR